MTVVANGKAGFTVAANHRSFLVGSDRAVVTWTGVNVDAGVVPITAAAVASEYPYWWLVASYCRSKNPIRSWPVWSYAPHGMNWSLASVSAVGVDHVAPRSKDSLTTTSEFVTDLYGSKSGAGLELFRMSDQTTARCAAFFGSAVMLPAAQVLKMLSWYVCRPPKIG